MQDNAPAHIFGQFADVVRQKGSMLTLMVKQKKQIFGVLVPETCARFECDAADVVQISGEEMEPKPMKSLGALTKSEKRFIVKAAWTNNKGYALNGDPCRMLDDGDIMCIFEYLQWQFQMPEVGIVRPNIVKMAAAFGDTEDGNLALMQIRDAMQQHEVLALPVHCDSPLHWTALELQLKPGTDEILSLRYGDFLGRVKQSAEIARKVLALISWQPGEELKPPEIPKTWNHYRQRECSNDCGFVVWHLLENAFKRRRNEGNGGVYPNPAAWRKTLKTLLEGLVKEQESWSQEEISSKKPRHPVSLPGEKLKGEKAAATTVWRKQFFTCSTCRWSTSGEGCTYCNPAKHEALAKEKEKRSKELAGALMKALQTCKDLGLMPADPEVKPPDGPLQAGGGDNVEHMEGNLKLVCISMPPITVYGIGVRGGFLIKTACKQ